MKAPTPFPASPEFQHATQPPPLNVINQTTLNSSPAESTLTANIPPLPELPPVQAFLDHEYINNEPLLTCINVNSWSSADVTADEVQPTPSADDSAERDGGDSDDEGEVMSLHVIAVARTIVDDNECVEVETMADAERIILSSVGDNGNEIDDEIGEPSEITGNETP
jgi:hypothetical protein